MVDALYAFARYVYDCGDYSRAATNLGLYRALVSFFVLPMLVSSIVELVCN